MANIQIESPNVSRLLLRLVPNCRLLVQSNCLLSISPPGRGIFQIDAKFASVRQALLSLAERPADMATLASIASASEEAQRAFQECLGQMRLAQAYECVWEVQGLEYATLHSLCGGFDLSGPNPNESTLLTLSRFALIRREHTVPLLESPEALCRISLDHVDTWVWLHDLNSSTTINELKARHGKGAAEFIALLWRAGFVESADEQEPDARAAWEFHDLLFHWRSREGRCTSPQGGTYRFAHVRPSPPAIKPRMSTSICILRKPDITEAHAPASLLAVVERRRSIRGQGLDSISTAHIGMLLYHSLRVQKRLPSEHQELLLKPVPAAGGIHEIEAYVAVNRCADLDRGLYHYHCEQHTLHRLATAEPQLSALIQNAASAWGKPHDPPQAVVILASRFVRLAWKYEGIAYRLTLLNAGVVVQSLYLLATELGLACSALGGGDSAVFAAATGLDPWAETSVAEFAIGASAPC